MARKKWGDGCGLLLLLVCILITGITIYGNKFASRTPQRVTLQAAPGNETVQMFEHAGAGDEGKVTTFRDGTICRKLSGPTTVTIEGIAMSFYKLDCGENSGYVNARWVDD